MFRSIFAKGFASMLLTATLVTSTPAVADDIINVDLSGVAPIFRPAFEQAEAYWDSQIQGFSNRLPRFVTNQLRDINIVATTVPIDGVGGILGSAGVVNTVDYVPTYATQFRPVSIAQDSVMNFDTADLFGLAASGDLGDVILHEMAHALGFGTLWEANGVLGEVNGLTQYTHNGFALDGYRRESGRFFSQFIPLEQEGGPGTALGHWDDDDPFFNRSASDFEAALMLGFLLPGNQFVSQSTLGSLADLWFVVNDINEGEGSDIRGIPVRKIWRGQIPRFSNLRAGSIPEPSAFAALAVLGGFLAVRRRKS